MSMKKYLLTNPRYGDAQIKSHVDYLDTSILCRIVKHLPDSNTNVITKEVLRQQEKVNEIAKQLRTAKKELQRAKTEMVSNLLLDELQEAWNEYYRQNGK
jgi:guanylate kinase